MLLAAFAVNVSADAAKYRNVFVEMGYQPAQVDAKLKEVFNDVFRGPNKVYFEVGDTMGTCNRAALLRRQSPSPIPRWATKLQLQARQESSHVSRDCAA